MKGNCHESKLFKIEICLYTKCMHRKNFNHVIIKYHYIIKIFLVTMFDFLKPNTLDPHFWNAKYDTIPRRTNF